MKVELFTFLSREECVRRLRKSTDPWWRTFGKRNLMGRVGESTVWLYRRARIRGNPLQPTLYAYLGDGVRGTEIHCRVGVPRWVQVTYALLGVFILYMIATVPLHPRWPELALWTAIYAVSFFTGYRSGPAERKYLLDFLRDRLGAKEP